MCEPFASYPSASIMMGEARHGDGVEIRKREGKRHLCPSPTNEKADSWRRIIYSDGRHLQVLSGSKGCFAFVLLFLFVCFLSFWNENQKHHIFYQNHTAIPCDKKTYHTKHCFIKMH